MTAEFWHYMGRDGVAVSFDWPSRGSLFSYQVDKANANFAIRQFRRLLEFLAANTSASGINILAHSAGNPIAVEALRQLSLMSYDLDDDEARGRFKIGRVVFAAPDMDLDSALSAGVDGAGRLTQGWIVYASRRDKALGFSADIFGDVRVGRSIGKLSEDEVRALIANDSQWIDATAAQKRYPSFLGHSYYHQNPWVSSDCMLFLALGATAEERGLVRDLDTGFLTFPDDYEERLPEIVAELRARYGTISFK
jgi:esterase/lipase superfamily enzyme